jgi:16S rRNA (cytidine1402-2'-O)-methyltransferase
VFFEAPHRIARTLTDLRAIAGNSPIALGRELTKTHEELVRGPITDVLDRLPAERGEFTVVVNIGQMIESTAPVAPGDAELAEQLGELTIDKRQSRRQAIADLARRHRLSANAVYQAIERAKNSGN